MGYSARYHAASLAAVFIALTVGILIGVGFGSDLVSGTAEDLEQSLESDLEEARAEADELAAELQTERDFSDALAPAVAANRLRGNEIALVAFGGLDAELADQVRAALGPSGGSLQQIAVVREPPDVEAVVEAAGRRGRPVARGAALERGARRAGRALVRGGEGFEELRAALFSRYSGKPGDIDAVVVVRDRPGELSPREAADTDRIEGPMIAGMLSGGPRGERIPVVGAERTDTEPSSVEFLAERGTATVDNVDQLPGRVALVYALDGAEGNYGVKDSASALLPDLLEPPSLEFGASAER